MARSDCSSTWYWRRICSYCSKVIISRPPIVKGFAVPFTIADLRTPGKLFEYISLSQWPTFSLQNTHMRAELVLDAIQTLSFEVAEPIWHSDQGKQYGAAKTRELLLRKGFVLSMSRAGTPTDNGYAERVRRCAFILLVGEVQHH